jgi:hypothetical protein
MTRREKKELLRQIAQLVEKAYRRGYQQGFCAASGELGGDAPTGEEVRRWRFAAHAGAHAVCPPGSRDAGRRERLLSRLECELGGMELIRQLLWESEGRA